jgi:polygalacturonase
MLKRIAALFFIFCTAFCAEVWAQGAEAGLPGWVKTVGARRKPSKKRIFEASAYGAVGDGETNSTKAIQAAIDACARAGGGAVQFKPGQYVTGALFIKSNVNFVVGEGVTLLGSQEDSDYPSIDTRVAGIEMKWPAALINVNEQKNVRLSGGGTIDGRGKKWWDRYWNLRRNDYEPRGLRWASDYDAERVRLMVVWKSADVSVENLSLKRSGFWTVQVVYSDHVTVDGIKISDNGGPRWRRPLLRQRDFGRHPPRRRLPQPRRRDERGAALQVCEDARRLRLGRAHP